MAFKIFSLLHYCFALESSNTSIRFVYGGLYVGALGNNIPGHDFHILSLLAFQWITVRDPLFEWRAYHTCHSAGDSQMIVIGGYDYARSRIPCNLHQTHGSTKSMYTT